MSSAAIRSNCSPAKGTASPADVEVALAGRVASGLAVGLKGVDGAEPGQQAEIAAGAAAGFQDTRGIRQLDQAVDDVGQNAPAAYEPPVPLFSCSHAGVDVSVHSLGAPSLSSKPMASCTR